LDIPKKELYVKKKKSQDMGVFSRPPVRDGTKEISERDWDDPRQNIHTHPSIKGFFYHLLQTTQPIIQQRSAQIGIHRVIRGSIKGIRG